MILCLEAYVPGTGWNFTVVFFMEINNSLNIALDRKIQSKMMHIKKQLDMKVLKKKKKFWELNAQWKESLSSLMSKLSFEDLLVLIDRSSQISVNVTLYLSSLLHNCSASFLTVLLQLILLDWKTAPVLLRVLCFSSLKPCKWWFENCWEKVSQAFQVELQKGESLYWAFADVHLDNHCKLFFQSLVTLL